MYCGGELEQSNTDPILQCPGCKDPMEKKTIAGITIDVCPSCNGSWFDRGELEEALIQGEIVPQNPNLGDIEDSPSQAYRNCPRCTKLMLRKNYKQYSGVIIDVCGAHGCYLDAGEFEQISQFIQSGGLERIEKRKNENELLASNRERTNQKHQRVMRLHKRRSVYCFFAGFFDGF